MPEPLGPLPSATNTMSGSANNPFSASGMPAFPATGSAGSSAQGTTPGKARKQAQAQRTRLVALSKHLMTRLQYATFKVEHGWTKQSLSEVENLYYRQNQGRSSSSTSPTGVNKRKAPTTPSVASGSSVTSRLFKDAALKKPEVDGGDVFGGYGLATPPASGGTHPSSYSTGSVSTSKADSEGQTPVSPPAGQGNQSPLGEASKRSPKKGGVSSSSSALPAKSGTAAAQSHSSSSASGGNNGVTSYADFWSRVGSSSVEASSVPRRSSLAGAKRLAEGMDAIEDKLDEAGGSPLKRVRMDLSASPAKGGSPLRERGPSFAAGASLPRLGRVASPSARS